MGAQRVALILSFLLEQIVATEYLRLEECQRAILLGAFHIQQVARQDNLVEEVPGVLIGQRTRSAVVNLPPGVIQSALLDILHVATGT